MKQHVFRLYRILVILALIPALLLISLRLGLPQLSRFSDQIADQLSQRIGMAVQIGSLNASLDQWRIRLQLNNLTLLSQRESEAKFSLRAGRVDLTLDLLKSVQLRSPVFKEAALEQADVLLQQYDGRWFAETASTDSQTNPLLGVLALLQHQPSIRLTDVSLGLQPEEGSIQLISPINALFEAAAGEYQFSGSIRIPQIGEDAYVVLAVHALELDPMDLLAGHYRFFLQSDALGPELLKARIRTPIRIYIAQSLYAHLGGVEGPSAC
ncbi:MAG: hypothetical protein LRY63_12235 [Nitrincola sp.]|nr:hypothetical protein [Nitrincola sp.]